MLMAVSWTEELVTLLLYFSLSPGNSVLLLCSRIWHLFSCSWCRGLQLWVRDHNHLKGTILICSYFLCICLLLFDKAVREGIKCQGPDDWSHELLSVRRGRWSCSCVNSGAGDGRRDCAAATGEESNTLQSYYQQL